MASELEVVEGLQHQGANEEISWKLTTTPWASAPSDVAVTAYDISRKQWVTSTVFPTNSPSVDGDVITLSPLKLLVRNHLYRIEVQFTAGGQIWEAYFEVECVI